MAPRPGPIAAAAAGREMAMSEGYDDDRVTMGASRDAAVTGPADTGLARPSAPRRSRRPRGAPARAYIRRGLVLPAAVTVALAAALLGAAPAQAGGSCHLRYVFNYDGSPVWSSMPVSDPNVSNAYVSCPLTPAIARWPGGTIITGAVDWTSGFYTWENPDGWGTYYFYGQFGTGSSSWGEPAMLSGSTPQLVIPLDSHLWYFTEPPDTHLQGYVELPGPSVSLDAPAIARTGSATEIAATGSDHSLWFYWNIDGTPTWGSHQIAGPSLAYGTPAIVADDNSTEVAYIAPDASLWFFWIINGTTAWHGEEVSGPGTVWGGVAMTHSDGGIQIAAPGPGGSIMFFWAADGTGTWHPEQVAGPGTMQGAPAMVAGHYTEEIAVTATDGSLRYYWSYDGTSTWYGAQIAPPGTASSSPAMTRFNGGTEIAAAGL